MRAKGVGEVHAFVPRKRRPWGWTRVCDASTRGGQEAQSRESRVGARQGGRARVCALRRGLAMRAGERSRRTRDRALGRNRGLRWVGGPGNHSTTLFGCHGRRAPPASSGQLGTQRSRARAVTGLVSHTLASGDPVMWLPITE